MKHGEMGGYHLHKNVLEDQQTIVLVGIKLKKEVSQGLESKGIETQKVRQIQQVFIWKYRRIVD